VRLHFQERPWDLYIGLGYVTIVGLLLLVLGLGNYLAILLVLFFPGYMLTAALFPSNQKIGWVERFALSVALSLSTVPLLGLALNFSPWKIRFTPIVVATVALTAVSFLLAYNRRLRLPLGDRLSATVEVRAPPWSEYSRSERVLGILFAASVALTAVTVGYVILSQRPPEGFTDFFILGPQGNASGYPVRLNVSGVGVVIIGLTSREQTAMNYSVRVDLVGVRIVYNSTAGINETIEVNRTTFSFLNASLRPGENWTDRYSFSIPLPGFWRMEFLLYKQGVLTSERLHIYVNVVGT